MGKHDWRDAALCKNWHEPNDFFENFENDEEPFDLRQKITKMCLSCPVRRRCIMIPLADDSYGYKVSGVYAGMYYENGEIKPELNEHVDRAEWAGRMLND